MIDPKDRFTEPSTLYAQSRPDYPAALWDWIFARVRLAPGDTIVDLGCGTGITTRALARRGLHVIGVDPNRAMLDQARHAGGDITYREGEAEALPVGDASVDLVTVGQAFHWFRIEPALKELGRVLRTDGACAAFWNLRDVAKPLMRDYEQLLQTHSAEYQTIPTGEETLAALAAHPRARHVAEATFPHGQALDRRGLHARAWSSSFVAHGVADRTAFDHALDELWSEHQQRGVVTFGYQTRVILFAVD